MNSFGLFDNLENETLEIDESLINSNINSYIAGEEDKDNTFLGNLKETFKNIDSKFNSWIESISESVSPIVDSLKEKIENFDPTKSELNPQIFNDYEMLSEEQRRSMLYTATKDCASMAEIDNLEVDFGEKTYFDAKNNKIYFSTDLLEDKKGYEAMHEMILNINKAKYYGRINESIDSLENLKKSFPNGDISKINEQLDLFKREKERCEIEIDEPFESLKNINITANSDTYKQMNELNFSLGNDFMEYNINSQEEYNSFLRDTANELTNNEVSREELDKMIDNSVSFEQEYQLSNISNKSDIEYQEKHVIESNNGNRYNVDFTDIDVTLSDETDLDIWAAKLTNENGDSFKMTIDNGRCFISDFEGNITSEEAKDMADAAYNFMGVYTGKTGNEINRLSLDYSNIENKHLDKTFYKALKDKVELSEDGNFIDRLANKTNKYLFDIKPESIVPDENIINMFDDESLAKDVLTQTSDTKSPFESLKNIFENIKDGVDKDTFKLKDIRKIIEDLGGDGDKFAEWWENHSSDDIKEKLSNTDLQNPLDVMKSLLEFSTEAVKEGFEALDDLINSKDTNTKEETSKTTPSKDENEEEH